MFKVVYLLMAGPQMYSGTARSNVKIQIPAIVPKACFQVSFLTKKLCGGELAPTVA